MKYSYNQKCFKQRL